MLVYTGLYIKKTFKKHVCDTVHVGSGFIFFSGFPDPLRLQVGKGPRRVEATPERISGKTMQTMAL